MGLRTTRIEKRTGGRHTHYTGSHKCVAARSYTLLLSLSLSLSHAYTKKSLRPGPCICKVPISESHRLPAAAIHPRLRTSSYREGSGPSLPMRIYCSVVWMRGAVSYDVPTPWTKTIGGRLQASGDEGMRTRNSREPQLRRSKPARRSDTSPAASTPPPRPDNKEERNLTIRGGPLRTVWRGLQIEVSPRSRVGTHRSQERRKLSRR